MTGENLHELISEAHRTQNQVCPYFSDLRSSNLDVIVCGRDFGGEQYEELLSYGFRRSSMMVYRPQCHGCLLCLPVRLDTGGFRTSKANLEVLRKNRETRTELLDLSYKPIYRSLYNDYVIRKHNGEPLSEEAYVFQYHESPFGADSRILACFRNEGETERLAAISFIDILPEGISSVYCAFDLDYSRLSPGTFTMLREISLCRELGKRWYYPGFWVAGCRSMEYKAYFESLEYCLHREWNPLTEERKNDFRTISSILTEQFRANN